MTEPNKNIKLEDIQKALTIEGEFEKIEDFNKKFNELFIKRDAVPNDETLAGQIVGKRMGTIQQAVDKAVKGLELEIKDDEWTDEMTVEQKIKTFGIKAKEHLENKVQEIKDASTGDVDKTVEKLTKKLDTSKSDLSQMTDARDILQTELSDTKTEQEKKLKGILISTELTKIKGDLVWKEGIKGIEKIGFDADLKENFKFEVHEEEKDGNKSIKVIVKDGEGKLIANETKTGDFLTPKELIELQADKHGLIKKNGVVEPKKPGFQPNGETEHKPGKYDVPLHSSAIEAAEKTE